MDSFRRRVAVRARAIQFVYGRRECDRDRQGDLEPQDPASDGVVDLTALNNYGLNFDGAGSAELTRVALGAASGAFLGSAPSVADNNNFEIFFGVKMRALSGTGVFLNPVGVFNAASFAPGGSPIAPGTFMAMLGTGLSTVRRSSIPCLFR